MLADIPFPPYALGVLALAVLGGMAGIMLRERVHRSRKEPDDQTD